MSNKKILILLLIVALPLLTVGCISIGGGGGDPSAFDGGVFKTTNKGETWQQMALISTVSGRPGTISGLNVSSMVMDPEDNQAIYFGSQGNGLFYTYDAAQSWQYATNLGPGVIRDVAIDPSSKCIIYAAVGNSVYKSTDCNRSWSRVYFDNDLKVTVNSIAIDYDNSEQVYIALSRGDVVKSFDRGVSWQTIHRFSNNVERITIDPYDARIIYVATTKKSIHRSNNSGATWVDLGDNLAEFKNSRNFRDWIVARAEPGLLFLATQYGLLRSDDGGDSWTEIELIPPQQQATINAIAISPKNAEEIYYITNTTFYRSLDGGKNWSTIKLPTTRAGSKLLIDPEEPNIIYMGVR